MEKIIWAHPVSQKTGPLKSDKTTPQSFSYLYIILIICTIILICFYSLPLNVSSSTMKPLNNELMPTLENEEAISILRELFGDFPLAESSVEGTRTSLPVTSNSPKTEVKTTIVTPQTTKNLSTTAAKPITEIKATIISSQEAENFSENMSKSKTEVKTSSFSQEEIENLSSSTATVEDEDLNTISNNPTVESHETSKEKTKTIKNNSKNQYSDTTEESQNTSPINSEEESTYTFATRTVSNPGATNNPNTSKDKSKTDVETSSFSQGETENLSASTATVEDEDLKTVSKNPSVESHETSKEKTKTIKDNSKNQYSDTTEESQNTSPRDSEEESTSTFAAGIVSNPVATNNPKGKKETPTKTDLKSKSINTTTNFLPEEEFLVFSDHCKIPNINPYHPSILKYISESPPIECKAKEPITKTEGNTLFIDEEAIRRRHLNISEITCLYHEIGRSKAGLSDNGIGFGFNHTFTDKVEINVEFIRVLCSFQNGTTFYQGFHSFIHDKPKVEKRCNQHNSSGYSVLIVGIDAMSRMNMHRQLKKTSRYLLKDMEAVEMYGFNKVGDNTFPNLMPILTGYDERELKHVCWNASRKNPLDKCNYAWKQFAKEGYRTFYAEDSPFMSTFNYVKSGFQYQPTDYYIRHFMLVMEQTLGTKRKLNTYACVGNISETEVVLRWTEQFASHFKDRKYFSFSWINGMTHDFLNKGSSVDHLYEKFFRNLHTSGAFNKTIVIAMGDHGMRWGFIRETYVGRLEERLPMLLIALPPEFKRKYPTEAKALQLNSRRLVTPFDIHATLVNILHMDKNFTYVNPDNVDPQLAANYTARANTLFQPVSEDRSCDDASIDEHWCTCESSIPVDTDDKIVLRAADFLVDYINSLLEPVWKKCAELELKSVTDARVWTAPEEHQGHTLNDTILTIIVKVIPSGAIFEGTVRNSAPEMDQELLGTVSRLNLYGNQSACIDDAVLRKYCYCS